MADFVQDSFADTPGIDLTAHVGAVGATWTQRLYGGAEGAFVISDANRVRCSVVGFNAGPVYYASGIPPSTDYSASVDFHYFSGASLGFLVRFDPTSGNGYLLQYRVFFGWRLFTFSGGGPVSQIGSTFATEMTAGQNVTATVTISGSNFQVDLSGDITQVAAITGSDATYSAAGLVGIYATQTATNSTGIHFDNIRGFTAPAALLTLTDTVSGAVTSGSTFDFGTVDTNQVVNRSYVLTNTGDLTLNVGSVSKTGARITITDDPSGAAIAPSGTDTLAISVDTSTNGAITGSVTVPSNALGSPFVVNYTGTVATPAPPAAPSNLSASASSSTTVDLGWTDNSSNETGFKVEWSSDGVTSWTLLTTTGPNATTYTDSTISASTTRYYRVRATNGAGDSTNSNVASATTPAAGAPLPATGLDVYLGADWRTALTWNRPSSGAAETSIVIRRQDGGAGSFNVVKTLGARENIWIDRSVWPATDYSYKIGMVNANGETQSSAVAVTMPASQANLPAIANVVATVVDAWTVSISWTQGTLIYTIERSDDSGLTYLPVGSTADGSTSPFVDRYLSPATTYKYRLRGEGYATRTPFSGPHTVTTSARPAGVPLEATAFTAVETSPTTVNLAWTDPNGGSLTYKIERRTLTAFSYGVWTQIATQSGGSSPGVVTYTDATALAFTPYQYRVRPTNGSGDGGYTVPTATWDQDRTVFTPRVGAGGRVFHVGPGQTYATFADFSTAIGWDTLGAGDTVFVHAGTYNERFMISCRGLPGNPVRIIGIADPTTGQRPIIDGDGATTPAEFSVTYGPYETYGVVFIGPHLTHGPGRPGWVSFENFEIRGGNTTFTGYAGGSPQAYAPGGGFYVTWCDHVSIKNCFINGTGANGLFGKSYYDGCQQIADLYVGFCRFAGNGKTGSYLEHNTYIEALRTVTEYNTYDPLKTGAQGNSGLKDRGVGSVHRFNRMTGQNHYYDLVEGQDSGGFMDTDPDEGGLYVYGCSFYSVVGTGTNASDFYHYGGDQGNVGAERKGILRFFHNTMVQNGANGSTRQLIGNHTNSWGAVDSRNNIAYNNSSDELDLFTANGVGYFGVNWISFTWRTNFYNGQNFIGKAAGTSNFVNNGATNDPGLVSVIGGDFRLVPGANAIGHVAALPANWPVPTSRYRPIATKGVRTSFSDPGAQPQQTTGDVTPPTLSGYTIPSPGTTLTATASEVIDPQAGWIGFSLSGTKQPYYYTAVGTALTLYLTEPISTGATVTLTYVASAGMIGDKADNQLANVTAASVTNNSGFVPDVTPPTVPGAFASTGVGIHSVSFSWTPSTDAGGMFGYLLYQDGVRVASILYPATTFTLTGVAPSVSKAYRLSAVDVSGNESAQAPAVNATAQPDVPAAPGAPTVLPTLQSVVISWTAVARATGYTVYRSNVLVGTTGAGITTYIDVTTPGVHPYHVVALGVDGNSAPSADTSGGLVVSKRIGPGLIG